MGFFVLMCSWPAGPGAIARGYHNLSPTGLKAGAELSWPFLTTKALTKVVRPGLRKNMLYRLDRLSTLRTFDLSNFTTNNQLSLQLKLTAFTTKNLNGVVAPGV